MIAVALGAVTALPAIGALIPALTGVGLAAVTTKLAFAGVGDAMALAGKDQEAYAEALAKMGPEQRAFTETLVDLKSQFAGIGQEIQRVALPGFTSALQAARPVVDVVKGGMLDMAGALGRVAEEFGKLFGSNQFQDALRTNLSLGVSFVEQVTKSFAPLIQSILDFGAASGPTLKVFGDGISALTSQALPGFIQGLMGGINGAAAFFRGLFDMINKLLPPIGELIGAISNALGPVFEQLFSLIGNQGTVQLNILIGLVKILTPVLRDMAYGIEAVNDLFTILWPTIKEVAAAIVTALVPAFGSLDEARGPFERLRDMVEENKQGIQEYARIFAGAVLDIVSGTIAAVPVVIGLFRTMVTGVLETLGTLTQGAADAFGWIPGIGSKLKDANASFQEFKNGFLSGLTEAEGKTSEFANSVVPRLQENKLKLDISSYTAQIETAKQKLATVPPEKKSQLEANIADLQNKVGLAKQQLASIQDKSVTVTTRFLSIGEVYDPSTQSPFGVNRRAHGGIVGAAGGGPRSNLTLVGEQGPELVRLPFGSSVKTNGDSQRMMAAGGPQQAVTINLYVQGSIRSDRDLIEIIRNEFLNGGFRGVVSTA